MPCVVDPDSDLSAGPPNQENVGTPGDRDAGQRALGESTSMRM